MSIEVSRFYARTDFRDTRPWPYGQAVKTPPFHGGNPGSIPGRVTNII